MSASLRWPEGVHVFGKDKVETLPVVTDAGLLACVHGISFEKRQETRNLAKRFSRDTHEAFHVGVLHCNCGAVAGHESYAACTLKDLHATGLDYWALGHVHERRTLSDSPCVAYPGNVQGLNINEAGPRGCLFVTVEHGHAQPEFVALDAVRWQRIHQDIARMETLDQLDEALADQVHACLSASEGRPILARITLEGRGPLYPELRREHSTTELCERLRHAFAADDPFAWIESIELECRPEAELAQLRNGGDFLAEVLKEAQRLRENTEGLPAELEPVLKDILGNRDFGKWAALGEGNLARLLDGAELICLDLLQCESHES